MRQFTPWFTHCFLPQIQNIEIHDARTLRAEMTDNFILILPIPFVVVVDTRRVVTEDTDTTSYLE